MRRYSVYDVYWSFWIPMVLVLAAGGVWRGCARSERNYAIEKATSDIRLLRAAEGRDPLPGQDRSANEFMARVKEIHASPEFGHKPLTDILFDAKNLRAKGFSTADIERFGPGSWKYLQVLAELGKSEFVYAAHDLSGRYPMQDILFDNKTVKEPIVVPEPIPWWSFGFWIWFYLVGSALFVLTLSLFEAIENGKHPVTQFPWHRVDGMLMAAAAAPATVPALTVYGIYRLAIADWTKRLPVIKEGLLRLAYQTRVIRHLPRPTIVVAPMQLTGPMLETAPANRVLERRAATEKTDAPLWYVMPSSVFLGHASQLKQAGIGVYPVTLKEPRSFNGWAVHAAEIEAFEKELRLTQIEKQDQDTDIERTVLRTYKPRHGAIEIDSGEDHRTMISDMLRRVSAFAGGVDLYFADTHKGRYVPPVTNASGMITIYHCSTPDENPKKMSYHRVFGQDGTEPFTCLVPAEGLGFVIRDQDGVPVAQVFGRVIYTLIYGMLSGTGEWRREALTAVLHQAVAESLRQGSKTEDDESAATAWRKDIEMHREKYAEICFDRTKDQKSEIEGRIASCAKTVTQAGAKITKALMEQREAEKQLDNFLKTEWMVEQERLKKEFDALSSSKYVLSVRADKKGIDVCTRTVFIEHLGKRYRIGRFRLRLTVDGGIGITNVANARIRNNGYEHPHIRDGGYICWGNIQQSISKLMADRQYAVVVNMVYRFLESYNPHGGVADINDWKEASNEE